LWYPIQDLYRTLYPAALLAGLGFFRLSRRLVACGGVSPSNKYALHCGTENGRGIEGGCLSDWAEIGSPPGEISALPMARMLREVEAPTGERQDGAIGAPDPLSAVSGAVLVPEPAPVEARWLPEDTTGLGSW
jgi:hypothetical protein